jgi:pimeloyl-ACP methyl ester carboxylesterase
MPKPQEMRDLIVLLPGVMGSVLKKDNKVVWGFRPGAITRALFTGGGAIASALEMKGDDPVRDTLDDGVTAEGLLPDLHLLPGYWKIDGYSAITQFIQSTFEVELGKNFRVFPYDWRRDNRAAARRLQRATHTWLQEWRRQSPDAKLILIAHSMGGIVSRYFLDVLEGWKDTKALITFGTPYRGSLNALDTLSNGLKKGPVTLDQLSEFCRSCTSIYQLLPIYPVYDDGSGTSLRVGETTGIPGVDAGKAKDALGVHREIMIAVDANLKSEAYQTGRYKLFPIVGNVQSTLQSAVLQNGRVLLRTSLENKDNSGDGTVPRVSAIPHEYGKANNATFAAMKHGSLQNTPSLLEHLEGVITGLDIDLGTFLEPDKRVKLSLTAGDVYFTDERVTIGVDAGEDKLSLKARIIDSVTGAQVAEQAMRDNGDGTYSADCGLLKEGSYRVEVGGTSAAMVADSFGVSERV